MGEGPKQAKRNSTDFDEYKDRYQDEVRRSISFVTSDVDYFTRGKAEWLLRGAARHLGPLNRSRVLDVGCGVGITDRYLVDRVGYLAGVDISPGVLEKAALLNPSAEYSEYDGRVLPYSDATFDLVFAICVMHHVNPAEWESLTREMARVTRKSGLVAIFEHNPYNPLTRVVVSRCEFDADAVLLSRRKTRSLLEQSGLEVVEDRYIFFSPFESRLGSSVEHHLGWLPLGAQYFVLARKA